MTVKIGSSSVDVSDLQLCVCLTAGKYFSSTTLFGSTDRCFWPIVSCLLIRANLDVFFYGGALLLPYVNTKSSFIIAS